MWKKESYIPSTDWIDWMAPSFRRETGETIDNNVCVRVCVVILGLQRTFKSGKKVSLGEQRRGQTNRPDTGEPEGQLSRITHSLIQ